MLVYIVSAIPFAYCISNYLGVDIRAEGSGNPGATNVTRVAGLKAGSIVFLLDFLKAAVPVFIAEKYCGEVFASVIGLVSVFAHVFPVYLAFKGGKGVAPMMGVYFALNPVVFLIVSYVWLVVFAIFRYPFIASLSACFVGAIVSYVTFDLYVFLPILTATLLILFRHVSNLTNFLSSRS
ncbi:glycerol-3-phosphate acyltransferase [Neorickettsia helminthoeca]|nr:glycerol-3-phosphate acyltransferase [Neorickettsia helminthoeca]